MSGVDVLAVLADLASSCSGCSGQGQRPIGEPYIDNGYVVDLEACQECADIHEARAAVAELIEKVDELLSSHGVYSTYGGSGESIEKGMHSELTNALSRVRGAE